MIADFCDYRFTVLQQRIDKNIEDYTNEVSWLHVKMQFINAVLDDKIAFKNMNKKEITQQILNVTDATDAHANRLLGIPFSNLTSEEIVSLNKQCKLYETDLDNWSKTTPKKQFIKDLKII